MTFFGPAHGRGDTVTFDAAIRREIARTIRAAVPEAVEIMLFGSYARGDARSDSDVDLVVLVPHADDRIQTSMRARRSLCGLNVGFDLLVLTPEDWQGLKASSSWFDRQITTEAARLDATA